MRLPKIQPVLIVLGVALVLFLFIKRSQVVTLLKTSKLGTRLTRVTVDSTGKIPVDPDALRKQAEVLRGKPISAEAFALGLMLGSEGPSDSAKARRARAWVARNDLLELKARFGWKNFTKLFAYSNRDGQNGFFGLQEKGRRYATWAPLYSGILDDAEKLLIEFATGKDPTGGATKFVDVNALGKQPGTEGKTLASIEKDWGMKGRNVEKDLYVFGGTGTTYA